MDKKSEKEKNYSQGISAPKDWWDEVEAAANEMSLGRSGFIRMAVNDYLKDSGKRQKPEPVAA